MGNKLNQKTVLITGGGKGIGRETARLFGRAGCRLVICGRDAKALERTAGEFGDLGMEVLAVPADVTRPADCKAVVKKTMDAWGRLDILINNAGMSMRGLFENTELDLFHRITDINYSGAVNMTKFALPFLLQSRGSVIFISSLSGLMGMPGIAPYGAAKMALKGFSESLACELSRRVHVGIIYVSFTENDPGKQIYDQKGNRIPLVREKNSSTQADVARSVLRMAVKRKRRITMTAGGKAAALLFALFPRLSGFLITAFAGRSKSYASPDLFTKK